MTKTSAERAARRGIRESHSRRGVRQPMRWWESLHFRFICIQGLLFAFVIGATIVVLLLVERSLLLSKGYDLTEEIGTRMVSELRERVMLAESLATTLANLGESLDKDVDTFKRVIPHLLNYEGMEGFIAGGGIWPEPNAFTPGVTRRSFFWGRNRAGRLIYYDDYNDPSGQGYHNEEWYLPATLLPSGRSFWSKSYMDPYSYQPMVTCSVPMIDDGRVIGVSTVDVKLEGLDAFFEETAKQLGGYIFAMDRNNKLLSFPHPEFAKKYSRDSRGNRTEEYLSIQDLLETTPSYTQLGGALVEIDEACMHRARSNPLFTEGLVKRIDEGSYQISPREARLIAAVIMARDRGVDVKRLFLADDPLLKEPVVASIFAMAGTYWKFVVVTPMSRFYAAADAVTRKVAAYVVILELGALMIMFFVLRKLFVLPVRGMARDVRQMNGSEPVLRERLDETPRHELGILAFEFNRRTTSLVDALNLADNTKAELEKKMAEQKQSEKERNRLQNLLCNIIDSMPSVLVGVDAQGNVTQWNKIAEETTGIAAGDAQGKKLSHVFPQMALEMEKVIESIRSRETKQALKRPRLSESGTCYEDVTIYPLIANGVEGAVIRIDDVTGKVRMEEMMIQSEKMLSVGGLAAGMAHEINNPMAGMMQTADVMNRRLTDVDMPANRRAAEEVGISMDAVKSFMEKRGIVHMIATINESGRRVAAIVNNMLSFARKSEASFSLCDLEDLLDKTLELAATDYDLKKQYDFKKIALVKEYDGNLPPVPCEGAKIQQVLFNILRNGAEAMQEAGTEHPRFVVRTQYDETRHMVGLEIGDNGPGMDEATRRRVFEPFFTTKSVGVGTGLGLSVSYFIITENHGGEMAVESAPGSGAKFIIRLPLKGRGPEH